MTFDDFLHALRNLTTYWWLDTKGSIRTTMNKHDRMVTCDPITALGEESFMYKYRLDAERLGLPYALAVQIAYASDYPQLGEPGMREALLRATVNKPTPGQYEAGLHHPDIVDMNDVHTFVQQWGGTVIDTPGGLVLSPYGKLIHVQVLRAPSYTPQPAFRSLEDAEEFYMSRGWPETPYIKGEK